MNARQRRRGRRWRQRVTDEVIGHWPLLDHQRALLREQAAFASMSQPVITFADGKVHTMTGFEGAPSWPWSSGLTWSVPEVV